MIEHVLHCCWLVDAWRNDLSYGDYVREWATLGWPVVLWYGSEEQGVPDIPGVEKRHVDALFDEPNEAWEYEREHKNHSAMADLLRYEVLYKLGGGYFDLDVRPGEPLKNGALDDLANAAPFWITKLSKGAIKCEIRFLLSEKGGEQIAALRAAAFENTLEYIKQGGHKNGVTTGGILRRTGPRMASKALRGVGGWEKYGLVDPTVDDTPENDQLHMTSSFDRVDAIAGFRGPLGDNVKRRGRKPAVIVDTSLKKALVRPEDVRKTADSNPANRRRAEQWYSARSPRGTTVVTMSNGQRTVVAWGKAPVKGTSRKDVIVETVQQRKARLEQLRNKRK